MPDTTTDREFLELSAKAAGIPVRRGSGWQSDMLFVGEEAKGWVTGREWSPLSDDGDAFRLAVALGLVVDCSRPSAGPPFYSHICAEIGNPDTAAATRRAIVRAAAQVQRDREQ